MKEPVIVLVSAGHHPDDPGAVVEGVYNGVALRLVEHQVMCQLAWYVIGMGPQTGAIQFVQVPSELLRRKVQHINEYSAKLKAQGLAHFCVELHADASPHKSARGATGFYYGGNAVGKEVGAMLLDSFDDYGFATRSILTSRDAPHNRLAWVDDTHCTSVLFETGFITNVDDGLNYACAPRLHKMALAITEGLYGAALWTLQHSDN